MEKRNLRTWVAAAWGGDYGAEDLEDNEGDEEEEDDQDDGVVEKWGAVYDSAYAAADAVTKILH